MIFQNCLAPCRIAAMIFDDKYPANIREKRRPVRSYARVRLRRVAGMEEDGGDVLRSFDEPYP